MIYISYVYLNTSIQIWFIITMNFSGFNPGMVWSLDKTPAHFLKSITKR